MPPSALAPATPPLPAEAASPRAPKPYRLWISPLSPPPPVVAIIAAGDRGQVVIPAGGITDGRTAAGVDIDVRAVIDAAAVDGGRSAFAVGAAADIAGADRVPLVATRVDLADDHDAAVGAGIGSSTVAGRRAVTSASAIQRRDAASGQTHAMSVVLALAVVIPATAVIAAAVVVAFSLAIDASIAVPVAIVARRCSCRSSGPLS